MAHRGRSLSDGSLCPADVVICGTGFRQEVPFLPRHVQERLVDGDGNFALYRQILPIDVPNLTFAGYNSSFFSPLSAEMAAAWIGSYLAGQHVVPSKAEMREVVREAGRLDGGADRRPLGSRHQCGAVLTAQHR